MKRKALTVVTHAHHARHAWQLVGSLENLYHQGVDWKVIFCSLLNFSSCGNSYARLPVKLSKRESIRTSEPEGFV